MNESLWLNKHTESMFKTNFLPLKANRFMSFLFSFFKTAKNKHICRSKGEERSKASSQGSHEEGKDGPEGVRAHLGSIFIKVSLFQIRIPVQSQERSF